MTSSLPHPALLEDLSKTCAPLSLHTANWWSAGLHCFFFVRECLFVRKWTLFYYFGFFLSLSGLWLHLSFIWLVSAGSSGFGQTGSRPAELNRIIHCAWTLGLVWTCLLRPIISDEKHNRYNIFIHVITRLYSTVWVFSFCHVLPRAKLGIFPVSSF